MTVTLLLWLIPVQALGAPPESKEVVCHLTGNGSFIAIEVAEKAVPAHLDHGDALVGDPVPDMPGYVFDGECAAELAGPAPACWDSTDGMGLDLDYRGPVDTYGNVLFWSSQDGSCTGAVDKGPYAMVLVDSLTEAEAKCEVLDLLPAQDPPRQGWLRTMSYPEAPADSYLCSYDGNLPW